MNNLLKKSLAALLALLMLLSVANVAVFATEGEGTETPATHEHTWDLDHPDIEAKEPTCTETGHGVGWTCTDPTCNEVLWESGKATIPARGHAMDPIAAVAATCTAAGNNAYYYCTRCEKYFKDADGNTPTTVAAEVVTQLGHDWDDGEVTQAATNCMTEGVKTFHCKREGCSETKTEPIAPAAYTLTKVLAL